MEQNNQSVNDHRILGQKLDLFHMQEEAPGMVFWHPRGLSMYRVLEAAVRRQCEKQGYQEVKSPQLLRRSIWESSGHWLHFAEHMFKIDDQSCEAALKPVSCPGHIGIIQQKLLSYRDFPLRLSELGVVHRDELSGALHGLLRVRQFSQDDGHVFCEPQQAEQEVLRFCESVGPFYEAFGFSKLRVAFSSRPENRVGDDESWDHAEGILSRVLDKLGVAFQMQPGSGAFYGPKLEFILQDSHGREWQCGTIQVDLAMPVRFDVRYVDRDGQRKHPIMLHRALYGSLERFLGIVLEHYGAKLPGWLMPVQVVVLPVNESEQNEAVQLCERLKKQGLRCEMWAHDSLSRRIAEAHSLAIGAMIVLGPKELASGQLNVRLAGKQVSGSSAQIEAMLLSEFALPEALV